MLEAIDSRVSTKSLVLPEIRDQILRFDPKKDIKESEWIGFENFFKTLNSPGTDCSFLPLVKNLAPERINRFLINDNRAEEIKKSLDENLRTAEIKKNTKTNWYLYAKDAAGFSLIYPDKTSEIKLDETVYSNVVDMWKRHVTMGVDLSRSYFSLMNCLSILFNEEHQIRFNPHHYITPDLKSKLFENLNDYKWKGDRDYIEYAANLKILFPNDTNKLGLNDQIWEKMRNEYQNVMSGNQYLGVGIAERLYVLAAAKVEVTKEGLKVTRFAEKFNLVNSKFPERRAF